MSLITGALIDSIDLRGITSPFSRTTPRILAIVWRASDRVQDLVQGIVGSITIRMIEGI